MEKPPIVYTDSRHIPVAIVRYVLWRDGAICVTPGCGSALKIEMDHCPPWNTLNPKRHDPDKIFCRCKAHHNAKSAVDTSESAKSKRVGKKHRNEWREPKVKLQGRGFDKTGPKRKIQNAGFAKKKPRH